MKKRNLAAMAALVALWLCISLTPPLRNFTSLAWNNWNPSTARRNFYCFYLSKRQWLADARTIVAGIRFLYESAKASPTNPVDVVNVRHWPPLRLGISTNLFGSHPDPIARNLQGV
jgi:hypothetical protein